MNRIIEILRLDHRAFRDQRITTHVGLAARALGASSLTYSGEKDDNLETSLADISNRWGGSFAINHITNVSSYIKNWKGIICHLSMYGEPHHETITTLLKYPQENLLIIVGGTKVPRYVYSLSDFNTAVGWQPHSEVSSIGIFLFSLNGGEGLYSRYNDAKISLNGSSSKAKRSERFLDI